MRKLMIVLAVVACILLITSPAQSQQSPGTIRVSINHPFQVGSIQLPAGEYQFMVDSGNNMMHIRNVQTNEGVTVFTHDIVEQSTPTQNKLVFQTVRGKYVLHKVYSTEAGHVHDIVHGTEVMELPER